MNRVSLQIESSGPSTVIAAGRLPFILACPLLLAAGAALAQASYEERWIRLADEHARQIGDEAGRAYQVELAQAHAAVWPDVDRRCQRSARRTGMASFQAVMVIDARGEVTEFLTMPRSEHLDCHARNMIGKDYPSPPVAPFYQVVQGRIVPD